MYIPVTDYTASQQRWASLKIMTANSHESRELSNFKHLENDSLGDLSANYIVQLLDSLFHDGLNGIHRCLVFELLGPSVHHMIENYRRSR
jgi:serine/threonine-protein kinase SRPK3